MNQGRMVFSQITDMLDPKQLSRCIQRYPMPFVGNEKIQMSLKQTGLNGDPISVVQVKRIFKDFSDYDAFLY